MGCYQNCLLHSIIDNGTVFLTNLLTRNTFVKKFFNEFLLAILARK